MKIILLGYCVPDEVAYKFFDLDPMPAIQTHKFGWSLARALKIAFGDVYLVSSLPVQNYPLVPRFLFRGGRFATNDFSGAYLGFVNLIILKHITRFISSAQRIIPLIFRKRVDWLFIHGLHSPYLLFGLLAKTLGIRVALVMTDPPGFKLPSDGFFTRALKSIDAWVIGKIAARADFIVSLSEDLLIKLTPNCKSIVFPGIVHKDLLSKFLEMQPDKKCSASKKTFTVVYAGGLNSDYGVDLLVEAILSLDKKYDIFLKIFGRGDQEQKIKSIAKIDGRIEYGGFLSPENLMPELIAADILVNPRPTTKPFASLSFPSKLLEYLAIGKPVLTTRIKTIPNILKQCFFYIDNETPQGIADSILEIISINPRELEAHAKRSRKIVMLEFSEAAIGKKISSFFDSNFDKGL